MFQAVSALCFLLIAESQYSTVCLHHVLFTNSLPNECLDYAHFVSLMNNAAGDSFGVDTSFRFLGLQLEVKLQGHMKMPHLTF